MGRSSKLLSSVVVAVLLFIPGCWADSPPPPPPRPLPPPGKAAVVRGNNDFAIDLYQKLRERDGNLVVSPSGLSAALAMAWAGARGETAGQVARVLHAELEPETYHPAFGALIRDWSEGGAFRMAGGLWVHRGLGLRDEFRSRLKTDYGAEVAEADLAGDPERARGVINAWAAKQIPGAGAELIRPGLLDADSRLVLANACTFQGAWQRPFEPGATVPETFLLADESKVEVPMMHQVGEFGFKAGTTFQALELRYRDDPRALLILLPRETDGLGALEWGLTAGDIKDLAEGLGRVELDVTLPRFTIRSTLELGPALAGLGMRSAFGPGADLSGMAGRPGDLRLSAVVQEARIEVAEEGTTASAGTALVVSGSEAGEARPKTFRADHPFLFLIRDTRSGSLLFLGRVVDPRGEG